MEDRLRLKGLENNVTKAHSFENLSKNEQLPLEISTKPLVHPSDNSTKHKQVDTRKEIATFANTSDNTVAKVKKIIEKAPEEEYQNLESSILTEGCRDSLVTWNGMIIDGHNRFEICTKNNIDFKTMEQPFDSRNDVAIWMIKNQFGRRNLIPYVRAELALKLEGLFQAKAQVNLQKAGKINGYETIKRQEPCQNSDNPAENIKENSVIDHPEDEDIEEDLPIPRPKNNYERAQETLKLEETFIKKAFENKKPDKKTTEIKPTDTKKELAKIAGMSHDTIERVKKIQEKAPEEVKQNLRSGEISINQAYKDIRREENKQNHVRLTQRF